MITLTLNKKNKTILLKITGINMQKRFYPVSNTSGTITTVINRLPKITSNNVLINPLYSKMRNNVVIPDTRCMTRIFNYPLQNRVVNPDINFLDRILGISFYKNISIKQNTVKFIDKTHIEQDIQGSFVYGQIFGNTYEVLNFINHILLKKEKIPNNYLKNLLINLNESIALNDNQKEVLFLLRKYFESYPITIDVFIEIWKKNNYEFKALNFAPKEKNEIKESQINVEFQQDKSYEEKKNEILNKVSDINIKMTTLFLEYDNDLEKICSSKTFLEWLDFLKFRGSVVEMQPEEIAIYEKLKKLYNKNLPKEEILLNTIKDNMKVLKEKSSLENILKQEPLEQCILPEDYIFEISRIKNSLDYLSSNTMLSLNDIKILAINSTAATIDAEGSFKLTQEAYKSFSENKDALGFRYVENKPKIDYILDKIKNNDYFVFKEITNVPDTVLDIAHLGHKTIIIKDEISGKNIFVRIGLLTSTDDNDTILLDKYQQTNPDLDKQNKKQFSRIFSTFIIVDENQAFFIDLETTLLLYGKNTDGELISELLLNSYDLKKNIWSSNNYQLPYKCDEEFLRVIAIIFYTNKLKTLEKNAEKLQVYLRELLLNDEELYKNELDSLTKKKINIIEEKKEQQYFSLLPEYMQTVSKALNYCEKKMEKYVFKQKAKEFRENLVKEMERKKAAKKEEEQRLQRPQTAREKREEYLRNKTNRERNDNENN